MTDALLIGPDRNGVSVAVVDGRIAATVPPDARRLACPEGTIAPGAVCAHTHLYSGLAPYDMPPPDRPPENFVQILEKVWWRLDRALDAEALRAAARDYLAKALLAGTTTVIDHHESPNLIEGSLAVLAEAGAELGIRAVLGYGATERNFGIDEARRGLDECARIEPSPILRRLVGLHASFTVSDATVRAAGDLARDLGCGLHVHVAEDRADVQDAIARGYAGPLERLRELGALIPGSIFAHGVHLSADQVRMAEAEGCWLVQNPRSNEGNGVGYAGVLAHSGHVALGTDGWEADMGVEQEALFRLATAHGDPKAGDRLAAGRILVAELFGAAADPLAPGALGDVVVRQDGRVRHVVVEGRPVVVDGRLATADLDAVTAGARIQADRLWRRMAELA